MNLKEFFQDADMILVGIGEQFQDKFEGHQGAVLPLRSLRHIFGPRSHHNVDFHHRRCGCYEGLEVLLALDAFVGPHCGLFAHIFGRTFPLANSLRLGAWRTRWRPRNLACGKVW